MDGDPLKDVKDLQRVRFVMKDGRVIRNQTAGGLSGYQAKTLSRKIGIQGQHVGDPLGLHDRKTDGIHQTHVPPIHPEQPRERASVKILAHPDHLEQRPDSPLEIAHRVEADAVLEQAEVSTST